MNNDQMREVLSASYLAAQLRGLARRHQSGLLLQRCEAELAKPAAGTTGPGLGRRLLAGSGGFLIWCGRRLRDWGGAEVPATLQY